MNDNTVTNGLNQFNVRLTSAHSAIDDDCHQGRQPLKSLCIHCILIRFNDLM